MPNMGRHVDITKLETRNFESKARFEEIMESVLGSVSSTVKTAKAIVVVDYKESLLIAAILSKSITTDGQNLESLVELNAKYAEDTDNLLNLKNEAGNIMDSNYSSIPGLLKPVVLDNGLSRIEYT